MRGVNELADIAASTSTTGTISVGGIVSDTLEVGGDHDWFRVTLTAGQSVTISLFGSGANPVTDTYLNLRNSAGSIITYNDDNGGTLNSKIVFTATTTGTYYIDCGAWDMSSVNPSSTNSITGNYTLSVQPYSPPPLWTNDQIANQLVNGYWNAEGANGHHFNVSPGGTITVNYSTLTSAEQALAIAALGEWSDIIGVTFTPTTSTNAQIVFDDSEDPTSPGPIAQTDGHWSNGIISTMHVQISSSWVQRYGTSLTSYSFQTYLHEIGHALGLGHAGNYNGDADYAADALYANDAWSTTVMSYFSQSDNSYFNNQGFTETFALTPMVDDILAMQQMYGLSTTTRTGNTTYGYNSNAGRAVYDATVTPEAAFTIFDSGGNDTIDYSGASTSQLINLSPEAFSNVGYDNTSGNTPVGNMSIARGTIIENAIGGSGHDQLIGNEVANVLTGNGGNDTLVGNGGDDFLVGAAGADTLTGGAGADTFSDTMFNAYHDTITDFGVGDRIVFTDALLSTFTFNVSGSTLTYNGFSLNLGAPPSGTLVATAASGGGVQLALGTGNVVVHNAVNDFNGDGRSDILWRNDNGALTDWLSTQVGGFNPNAGNILTVVSTDWKIAGTGDFNGDGKDDILWRNTDGRITDWLGTATGGFSDNVANAYNGVSTDWSVAAVGDFNGDHRDDILWRNADGRLTDWLGTTSGGFSANAANVNTGVSTLWQVAGVGDFNGDGKDDILWRSTDGRITDWLGTATGGFSDNAANALNGVSLDWHVAGIGDFNGDGRDDILWRNTDGRITDWLGTSTGGFAPNSGVFYDRVSTAWTVASVGDFNGDGRDDILFRNTDGRITDWLGQTNGSFTDNAGNSLTGVATSWHVNPVHDTIL